MGKRTKPVQAAASSEDQPRELSWREERFIEAYLENGENATAAARSVGIPAPAQQGYRLLSYAYIQEAIERRREDDRQLLRFNRTKALKMLAAMAGASLDDFADLFIDAADRENYRGLGLKRLAIESVKKTTIIQEDGTERITNEIRIISPGERRAALNDLWDKLGLSKDADSKDWRDTLAGLLGAAAQVRK